MTTPTLESRPGARPAPKPREWAPRFWEGCNALAWWRLLIRNRFAVHGRYLYIAAIISAVSLIHSLLRCLQWLVYGRRIARTVIREAPIFIIGHWRTGTTLLHELLILDPRHTYPKTYDCLVPNHFLLTERFFLRWMRFLMPAHRPMDNMAAGWERPQEDEFALCMLGRPSPYLTIAFPNRGPQFSEYLDLERVSPHALGRWRRTFLNFLRTLTLKDPRRLVLKSPPHTCRIKVLLDMFPNARFVHIVRDPLVVFPSTVNLWKSLYRQHGLQTPHFEGLEEHVFATFSHMYAKLEETRSLVPPGQFHELKYEDLVRDPVRQMGLLYEQLGLKGFDLVLPRLEEYWQGVSAYATNRYQLSEIQRKEITHRWRDVIERYGYRS